MNISNELLSNDTINELCDRNIIATANKSTQAIDPRQGRVATWVGVDVAIPDELKFKSIMHLSELYIADLKRNAQSTFFGATVAGKKKSAKTTPDQYYFVGIDLLQTNMKFKYVINNKTDNKDSSGYGFMVMAHSQIEAHAGYKISSESMDDKAACIEIMNSVVQKELDFFNAVEAGHVYDIFMHTRNNEVVIQANGRVAVNGSLDDHIENLLAVLVHKVNNKIDAMTMDIKIDLMDFDNGVDVVGYINDKLSFNFDTTLVYGNQHWCESKNTLSITFLPSSLPKFSELRRNYDGDMLALIESHTTKLVDKGYFGDIDKWELVNTLMNKDNCVDWSPLLLNAMMHSLFSSVEDVEIMGKLSLVND